MACKNCLENCEDIVTDKCIKYTGPDIDFLGVCKGMTLYEIEEIIFAKLQTILGNSGGTLPVITTTCTLIKNLIGSTTQPFTLGQFAEIVFEAICNLDYSIKLINDKLNAPATFNTSCLTGDLNTRDKILQAVILKACANSVSISNLEQNTVSRDEVCSLIQECLETHQPTASSDYKDRMVPYIYYPYGGSLSNFDNTGKGIASLGFDKVYIANGLNGTQDWRGVSPIGAIKNVPGGVLDAAVDPAVAGNAAYNYILATKYGKSSVRLVSTELPSHIHTITDSGHTHFSVINVASGSKGVSTSVPIAWSSNRANGNQDYDLCYASGTPNAGVTSTSYTGISGTNSTGGDAAHTNLHPVVGCLYIVYIP